MGREAASALGRWFVFKDFPAKLELYAVCDLNEELLQWYDQIDSVNLLTTDYKEMLADDKVDVVYVAVPHNLHEQIYLDVLNAGKDLLAEKPFGINRAAAENIYETAQKNNAFVRCSSEFPFLPGVQRVIEEVKSGRVGKIMEIRSGFHHASDMNPNKPINWKRMQKFCGEIGVMGDLGMHAVHVPLRMGCKPKSIYAQLQNIIKTRPDGKGGVADCDTWDNATIHANVDIDGDTVPMRLEMKRMAPGETNSWYLEVIGTEGSAKYTTKEPKTFWTFKMDGDQIWQKTDLGFNGPYTTITGPIFEPGFPDCFQQMLGAYVAERQGFKGDKFGCATPEEALASHAIFEAALESHKDNKVVDIKY